jgi:hypothetical protein
MLKLEGSNAASPETDSAGASRAARELRSASEGDAVRAGAGATDERDSSSRRARLSGLPLQLDRPDVAGVRADETGDVAVLD